MTLASLLTEIDLRSKAWRQMESQARREGDSYAADRHATRAETLECLARDLREQPVVIGR